MLVRRLSLTDFRNYERLLVELDAGPTLLVGFNGQGKTNLVEALVYLATGSSHRVPTDAALVRAGAEEAFVRASLEHDSRTIEVDLNLKKQGANRAVASGNPIRMSELPRYLSAVLFSPEDLALVRGDPGGRRKALDQLLVSRQPRFAGILSDLDRVIKQRTSLLKSARAARLRPDQLGTLDVWDDQLAALSVEIFRGRSQLVEDLKPKVAEAYKTVAGSDHETALTLETNVVPDVNEFVEAIRARRVDELDRGVTLLGPHRDDLILELNGLLARHYASHGESWSFALALRLASAWLMRSEAPGDPVLILDDVFAELDASRREKLATAIADFEQVLITAAVDDDVPHVLGGRRIRISAGQIVGDSRDE